MSTSFAALDAKELRPLLHAELDRLPDEELERVHRALLQIEMDHVVAELDASFDQARSEGRLTAESIATAIKDHRAGHPYRR